MSASRYNRLPLRPTTQPQHLERESHPMRADLPQQSENKLGDLHVVIPQQPQRQALAEAKTNRIPLTSHKPYAPQLTYPQKPVLQPTRQPKRSHGSRLVEECNVPAVMYDKKKMRYYTKMGYLGEGGFARCYKVKDANGRYFAAKVIAKAALKDQKNKAKLFAEINIHRSMKHTSIVRFFDCFEDSNNVYLIVELCENKTLVEMLKKRGRLTEPELRYFLIQILDGCRYMHDNNVIHRDIKLSNIFLDKNMDVKIGDFGLAAFLVDNKDRKKTICGTPNYIAPEILFDKNGHNHKVDMWSIGVLVYTLLVGIHPFQQNDVKRIYKKIKANSETPSYTFPRGVPLSADAKDLVSKLLVNQPEVRQSVPEILQHPFFQNGSIPAQIPLCALERTPHDSELFSPTHTTQAGRSPGKAADALRTAIDQNKSYVDTRPVGPLKIMSEHIPDPKTQFPLQRTRTYSKEEQAKPSTDAGKDETMLDHGGVVAAKRSISAEIETKNKRRDISVQPDHERTSQQATMQLSSSSRSTTTRVSLLGAMSKVLSEALESPISVTEPISPCPNPTWKVENVFINKWVDFSAKYGLGYNLSDGSYGVLFNDATTLITQDNRTFYYISQSGATSAYPENSIPAHLKKKIYLLHNFREYMSEKLAHLAVNIPEPKPFGQLVHLSKYMTNKKAVVFRLSNSVIQMSFHDRSKLILTENATRILHITAGRELVMYPVHDAVALPDTKLKTLLMSANDILLECLSEREALEQKMCNDADSNQ